MFLSKKHGVYHLFYTNGSGTRLSRSTGSRTKAGAVKFLRAFNAEEDARQRALRSITLKDFAALYVSYSRRTNTPKTAESNETALNELCRVIGPTCVTTKLTPADCERFLAQKTVEASVWTARKYYLALSAAFERARTWGHVLDNPWRKVAKPRTPEVTPAYFTRQEIRTVLSVIKSRNLRELVTIAVLTGLRRGELLAMEWSWCDFSRRTLTVKNTRTFTTKSKRERVVPLCDEAFTLLLSRRERMNAKRGLVFHLRGKPLPKNKVTKSFKKAVLQAGLSGELHFHSLRHTFASWLVQDGVSLYQVGKLLGHSTMQVTEIYAHLVPHNMHNVLGPLHLEN